MPTVSATENDFPIYFWGIVKKSITLFGQAFFSYLILSAITFIPFLIIDQFSGNYAIDLIEFFHGNFLDIIIFLTLPTIYLQSKVFPFATIQLFFQRFFASAVVISLVQFGTLTLFTLLFAQISIGIVLIGMIPYIYLIFAGFFLILENSTKLISIRSNLLSSINLVRSRFFVVFIQYFFITFITSIPFVIFFMWYMAKQPEFTAFQEVFRNQPENTVLLSERLSALLDSFSQPGFKWARIAIHVLFRPLKSLFLSYLFLGILFRLNSEVVNNYLGYQVPEDETDEDAIISEDPEEN